MLTLTRPVRSRIALMLSLTTGFLLGAAGVSAQAEHSAETVTAAAR